MCLGQLLLLFKSLSWIQFKQIRLILKNLPCWSKVLVNLAIIKKRLESFYDFMTKQLYSSSDNSG